MVPDDCVTCGACCFSRLDRYVPVSGDDHERIARGEGDEAAERFVVFIGNRAYLRMRDGHCAALSIDPNGGRFFCSMYASRPATCRELERGSPNCVGERDAKLDRTFVASSALLHAKRQHENADADEK